MTKLTVTLPPALGQFIKDQVADGLYADEGELVRDAIRRMATDFDGSYEARFAALREALRPGLEDADAGRFSSRSVKKVAEQARAVWEAETKR